MKRATAVIAGLLLVLGMGVNAASAVEEDSPVTTESTTTTVLGTSTVPTTTTTTEAPTTTEEPTTTVAGDSVVPTTTTTAAVAGDVVSRPLPRTGNDIGGTVIFGGALTILGIALALGARKRRNNFDGA